MSASIINFNTSIENSFDFLIKKYENLYKDINFKFIDYYLKFCYDLIHKDENFISDLKNIISESIDFCNMVPYRIEVSDEQKLYVRVRDLICKYTETEFMKMMDTGIWLKEKYNAYKDMFFDEELLKFLNGKYSYDYSKFNCFLVLIYKFHVLDNMEIEASITESFNITDICYGNKFLEVFYSGDNPKYLSYFEFCEFFIRRSNICYKNKVFSEIEFEKLPEFYNLRDNKLSTIEI